MKQFGRVLRPNRAGAFVGLVVVIFVAVLAACSSSKDDAPTFGTLGAGIDQPDSVKLQLYLDGNNLTLLGAREAQDDPRGPITSALEPVIYWEFVDDSGKTVAMGAIRDPRVMHGETPDAMGNLSRYETTVPQALLDIDIPNVGGELRLYDNPTYAMSASGTSTMSLHPLGIFSSNPFASIKVPQWLRDLWNRFFGKKDPPPPPPKTDDQIGLSHPVNHGNCGREFNILIVGEGYTQAQLGKFQSDAQQVANDLAAQAGYSDNWTQVNVHTLALASQDTGIYDPQMPGVQKNTAFNIGYGDPANGGVRRCALPRGGGPPASTQAQVAEAQRRTNANVTAVIINVDGWDPLESTCRHASLSIL